MKTQNIRKLNSYKYFKSIILAVLVVIVSSDAVSAITITLCAGRSKRSPKSTACSHPAGICWHCNSIGSGIGEVEVLAIVNGSQIHFIFLEQPEDSITINGMVNVDTNTALSTEKSNSLGFQTVIVVQGNYAIDFSTYPYGETTVDAILIDPLPTLDIKIIPEGYLFAASINTTRSNIKDKSTVSLRSMSPPFNLIDTATVSIDSLTLTGKCFFKNAGPGNYYIAVNHRNSLETWSSNPVSISAIPCIYDFTTSSSKAYGGNLSFKLDTWCTYSGDVTQDGSIDLSDVLEVFNAAASFTAGNAVTDLDGDRTVDLSDLTLVYNNSGSFVLIRRP